MAIVHMFKIKMNINTRNDGSFRVLIPKLEADITTYLVKIHIFCIFFFISFHSLLYCHNLVKEKE